MELNDTLVSERKKEVFEFSRDVVVGAENPRSPCTALHFTVLTHLVATTEPEVSAWLRKCCNTLRKSCRLRC